MVQIYSSNDFSDVFYRRFEYDAVDRREIYVGSRHEYEDALYIRDDCSSFDKINVNFHNTLSSEIKDEICSKLASALRALKSRISRICGINELERRVSLT